MSGSSFNDYDNSTRKLTLRNENLNWNYDCVLVVLVVSLGEKTPGQQTKKAVHQLKISIKSGKVTYRAFTAHNVQ